MAAKLAWLALAGTLGTWARFGLAGLVQRLGPSFPIGTLAVNTLGCFLFGVVWTLAEDRLIISGQTRFIILTGFMGAFTTFSTFAFETGQMMRDAEWLLAGLNVVVEVALGLGFFFLGIFLGRQF